ncbi:hypothetical protein [Microtetraspora fusca]|uniref:hypothetical protein n=1 Tax=Microtetraspora fusca TaxID=1997 RepID=UPI000A67F8C7|nr:hypothetical protein [Microtetraspora fusca]
MITAAHRKPESQPPTFRTLLCAAVVAAALTGCGTTPACKPCAGHRVQLTVHHSIVRSGLTYQLCDAHDICREGPLIVPSSSMFPTPAQGLSTPAGAQDIVFNVNLPGQAIDYSRMPVRVVVKNRKGQVVGRGEATFPEYPPIEAEPCYCYNAFVKVDVRPGM